MKFGRRSGLTRSEVLVILVILAMAGVFLLPLKQAGRERAYTVQCSSNLKHIYSVAMAFSDGRGKGFYPATLNELVAFDPESLDPKLFFCPVGDATPAERDTDGRYVLRPGNTSYAWTTKPLENTTPDRALASDKYVDGTTDADGRHAGHPHGMNVLYTDSRVGFVREEDLPGDTHLPAGLSRP
jgi:hypothetical protein